MLAAFANGTHSEVLDFQDTDMSARIHNGVTVIPAALAIAQTRKIGGREFLAAVVAGYEVGSRLAHVVQPEHWYRGFQATGTFGHLRGRRGGSAPAGTGCRGHRGCDGQSRAWSCR